MSSVNGGRITIPFEIRKRVGFAYNDILSFTEQDDRTVVVKREKICDECKAKERAKDDEVSLLEFLNSLTPGGTACGPDPFIRQMGGEKKGGDFYG